MNRRILAQVAGPTVIIGVMLFAACLVGAWYVQRLQRNLDNVLAENLASLRAAQQLETQVRELSFHSFLYLVEPSEVLLELVKKDEARFEDWLAKAQTSAKTKDQQVAVRRIGSSFQRYQHDLEQMRLEARQQKPGKQLNKLALGHPPNQIIDQCHHYGQLYEETIARTSLESEQAGHWAHLTLLLLGVGGPIGGLLSGYGISRGLSRSLYRLNVRVQDMAQHLETEVGAVKLQPGDGLEQLDQQLDVVVQRLAEVVKELHRRQADALRSQQLSAVGQLAASVAHEVRNPLTSIKMLVEAGLGHSRPRPFTQENLQVIHGEILRLEQTVQSFLDFARPPAPKRVRCDLRGIIERSLNLVRTRARHQRIALEWLPPPAAVDAVVDGGQLANVLVNLFLNAFDAMPDGGKVLLELHEQSGTLILSVRDTGTGIHADILDKLFVPFNSSKPTGSGLGLSICRRILQEHGGTITGANDPAGGACFTLVLPSNLESEANVESRP